MSPARLAVLPAVFIVLLLAGCSSSSSATSRDVTVVALSPTPSIPEPSSTPESSPTPAPSATPAPSPTTASTATPLPQPTATPPAAAGAITINPPRIEQGGVAFVELNLPATAATVTFGGLRYPMLGDGNRLWALVGVGAFTTPGDAPVTVTYTPSGASSALSVSTTLSIGPHSFPIEEVDLDPQTSTLLAPDIVNNEIAKRAAIFATYTPDKLWSGPFVRPSSAAIGDVYGSMRSYNGAPPTDYHRGTDFLAFTGDPAVAAASGRVAFAGALQVRGNTVIIDHGAGLFTSYSHFSRIDVAEGQMVTAGQQIGLVGATGLVTGPHLHWEVIVRGVEVDGRLWLQGDMEP